MPTSQFHQLNEIVEALVVKAQTKNRIEVSEHGVQIACGATHALSCAVNATFSKMSRAVSDGDDVAFLPPVSGG